MEKSKTPGNDLLNCALYNFHPFPNCLEDHSTNRKWLNKPINYNQASIQWGYAIYKWDFPSMGDQELDGLENPMKKWLISISGYPHDLGNLHTNSPSPGAARSGPPCHRGSCDAGGDWRDGRRVWAAGPLAPAFMAFIPNRYQIAWWDWVTIHSIPWNIGWLIGAPKL